MRHLAILALVLSAPVSGLAAQDARGPWVGAWGYASSPAVDTPAPTRPAGTFSYRIRLTQSGRGIALRFTNPENAPTLDIARVSVATADNLASSLPLTFRGKPDTVLAAGASISTDPGRLVVIGGQDVVVTMTTRAPSVDVSGNAGFVTRFAPADGTATITIKSRPFVTLASVHNAAAPCTIVTLGDSITEGARGTLAGWRGWPGRLAQRLIAASPDRHCGVVNSGISGNRLLTYGRGPAAIERFGRDVAGVPGVTHVVLLEGINDIARSGTGRERRITAADLIAGYKRVIAMAHDRKLHVIGATLTPGWGSRFLTTELEAVRRETNGWIRTSGAFDGVVDFEAALSDGSTPAALQSAFDSGDKLHPGDAGYDAMAQAVPLDIFASAEPVGPAGSTTRR